MPWMFVPGLPWVGCTMSQITVPASIWVSQLRLSKSTIPWSFSTSWGVPTVRGKCSSVLPSSPGTGGTQEASFWRVRIFSGALRRFTASWSMPKVTFLLSRAERVVSQVTGAPSPRAGSAMPQAALQLGVQNTSTWPSTGGMGTSSSGTSGGSSVPSFFCSCFSAFITASLICLRCAFITAPTFVSSWENTCFRKVASGGSSPQKSSITERFPSLPWPWQ